MTNKTRKKKESFVVFEDWLRYAKCLNDAEHRQLVTNLLNYYKGIEPILNTPNLQEVWSYIIDDLEINVSKKQAKRDIMLKNSLSNPKLNIRPDIRSDIGPDISSNTILNTGGMVDGICEMEDVICETQDTTMRDKQMSNVSTRNTSSIPGRFKPDEKLVDEMFGPE